MSRLAHVREAAMDTARKTKGRIIPTVENAGESVTHYATEARDRVASGLQAAQEKIHDDILPKVGEAVHAARAVGEPIREEALARGSAALAALQGKLSRVDKHRGRRRKARKIAVLAGVLGGAAAAWAAWRRRCQPAWLNQLSDDDIEGTEASTSSPANKQPSADAAGAGPDEAVADAASSPKTRRSSAPRKPSSKQT